MNAAISYCEQPRIRPPDPEFLPARVGQLRQQQNRIKDVRHEGRRT